MTPDDEGFSAMWSFTAYASRMNNEQMLVNASAERSAIRLVSRSEGDLDMTCQGPSEGYDVFSQRSQCARRPFNSRCVSLLEA